jgi:hypothetical protein
MPAYLLSEFHEGMRTLLGDEGDPVAGYDFVDEQLNGALRTAVRMGRVPGVALSSSVNPDSLVAAPANMDTWGYLVAKAVLLMIGGKIDESFKTRALTVRMDPAARRNAVSFLENELANIEASGNVGGTADDTAYQGLFATQADVITSLAFLPALHQPPWTC